MMLIIFLLKFTTVVSDVKYNTTLSILRKSTDSLLLMLDTGFALWSGSKYCFTQFFTRENHKSRNTKTYFFSIWSFCSNMYNIKVLKVTVQLPATSILRKWCWVF